MSPRFAPRNGAAAGHPCGPDRGTGESEDPQGDGTTTCWDLLRGAAGGRAADREEFARRYGPVVRAFLRPRFRGPRADQDADDAFQDVLLECLRPEGVLSKADPAKGSGFRGLLFGVARNVAARYEERRALAREAPLTTSAEGAADPAEDPALAFDRAWARNLARRAADAMALRAAADAGRALERVELLRLRFEEGLPIREIAARWSADPAEIHHAYAQARIEFQRAFRDLVVGDGAAVPSRIEEECRALLRLL